MRSISVGSCRGIGMSDVVKLARIVHEVVQGDIARCEEFGECGPIAVFLRAEPAHQFVPAIYDAAEKVPLREVRRSIFQAHLSNFFGLAARILGELPAHIAELLERACEAPVRIQHIERIPTNERSIAGHVDAAARPGFGGIGDYAFETAPLEVWIAFADLFFAKTCERQERRREVQMRADGRGALPLRSTWRANGQIDDASFVERDAALLCHPVGAVHFAVVPRENHHGVLPKIQAVECSMIRANSTSTRRMQLTR